VCGHRDPRCSYTASRGVHCHGQLNTGDHPKYRQKTPITVVISSEHTEVNRGDGCSNEGSALAVLYIIYYRYLYKVYKYIVLSLTSFGPTLRATLVRGLPEITPVMVGQTLSSGFRGDS